MLMNIAIAIIIAMANPNSKIAGIINSTDNEIKSRQCKGIIIFPRYFIVESFQNIKPAVISENKTISVDNPDIFLRVY